MNMSRVRSKIQSETRNYNHFYQIREGIAVISYLLCTILVCFIQLLITK